MVTTKKISSEFTQKEMRRKSKRVTPKKSQWNTKGEEGDWGTKKATNLAENKIASPSLLVIISNVTNGLNPSIKRLRLAEWIK